MPEASVIAFDHELRCVLVTGQAVGHAAFDAGMIEGLTLQDRYGQTNGPTGADLPLRTPGEAQSVEVECIDTSLWYRVEIGPWHDAGGGIAGGLLVARDITERRKVDGVAVNLAAVVASSTDAIISKTVDGTIVSWNPGAERLYGYSEAEMIGQSMELLRAEGHDDQVSALLGQSDRRRARGALRDAAAPQGRLDGRGVADRLVCPGCQRAGRRRLHDRPRCQRGEGRRGSARPGARGHRPVLRPLARPDDDHQCRRSVRPRQPRLRTGPRLHAPRARRASLRGLHPSR